VPFNESTIRCSISAPRNVSQRDYVGQSGALPCRPFTAPTTRPTPASISSKAGGNAKDPAQTRAAWCEFYQNGRIAVDLPESSSFQKGELFKDIGYWNLMFDSARLGRFWLYRRRQRLHLQRHQLEFRRRAAGQQRVYARPEYKTLTTGYSSIFTALFEATVKLAKDRGVRFEYHPDTRLHSILKIGKEIRYGSRPARAQQESATKTTDAAGWR